MRKRSFHGWYNEHSHRSGFKEYNYSFPDTMSGDNEIRAFERQYDADAQRIKDAYLESLEESKNKP